MIHSVEVVLHPPLPSPSGNKTLVKQLCNHFWKPIPTEFKHDALLQCFSRNSKWLQIEKKIELQSHGARSIRRIVHIVNGLLPPRPVSRTIGGWLTVALEMK